MFWISSVAGEALVGQDRPNVAIEVNFFVRKSELAIRSVKYAKPKEDRQELKMLERQDRDPRRWVGTNSGRYTSASARVASECDAIANVE